MGTGDVEVNRTGANFRDGAIFDGVDDLIDTNIAITEITSNDFTISYYIKQNIIGNEDWHFQADAAGDNRF